MIGDNIHTLGIRAPPVPLELRHLPPDHKDVVLREPARFGRICMDRASSMTEIHSNRIPTSLTQGGKEFMYRCEKSGRTQKHQFQDSRQAHMHRCPSAACGYAIINSRTMPGSIGAHLREFHFAEGQQFQVHYFHKGQMRVYQHNPQDTSNKQTAEVEAQQKTENTCAFAKKARPSYKQPTILDAFLKIRQKEYAVDNISAQSNERVDKNLEALGASKAGDFGASEEVGKTEGCSGDSDNIEGIPIPSEGGSADCLHQQILRDCAPDK